MREQVEIELAEILREAREQARFLGELGVETVDLSATRIVQAPDARLMAKPDQSSARDTAAPSPRAVPRKPLAPQDALFEGLAPATPVFPRATEALADIWRDIGDCTRCGLCEGRTQVVNTHGNHSARLMFVGEAPGADEDAQGKPFVGRAGQLLTKMIEAMGIKREEVIIGNVNRCRPPGNRQPTLEEAAICRPFLFREIAVIQPEVIVVMGNTALRNLLEVREGITRVRGKFQDFRGIKVMPTFHPAYLLRDPSKKKETWEDLKMVRDYLQTTPPKAKS
ncbi:MAG TPA: uracil-DNA glycosylase [Pyrinomonadaceae bacterium]|nr:uracil-DNA glycosylase [Pyrinomonadaceae bacterium]